MPMSLLKRRFIDNMYRASAPVTSLVKNKQGNIALSWPVAIFALLMALYISLRLFHITSYSLWGGEAFTMIGVQQGWRDMFSYIVEDIVHPPLFYILLKLWIMTGGESLFWLKLFAVLPSIAVVVPFLLLCRELKLQLREINLALLLLAVNGYMIHYAQELRMYSLFTFLAMLSFWLFIRLFNSSTGTTRQLILLTLVNLLTIYTHYYGWVVVGAELLFLLIWQRGRALAFGLSIGFLMLCFAPWTYLVVQEARSIGGLDSNLDWIPKPGINTILNLYVTFNGPLGSRNIKVLGLLIFGLPLLFWFWQLIQAGLRSQKDELIRFSWLTILAFLPVIALFVISQRFDVSVWMDRYFIFIAIPYMLLVAAAAFRLKPVLLRNVWIVTIVALSVFAGLNDLRTNRMAWESPQLGSRIDWNGLAKQMVAVETGSTGPIKIYTMSIVSKGYRTGNWAISTSLDYFFDMQGEDKFQTLYARNAHALLEQTEEDHFWVGYFDLEEWPQTSPATVLANNGFHLGEALVVQEQNNRLVLLPVWRE
jgi:hypothetical protein